MRKNKGIPVFRTMADITKITIGTNGKMMIPSTYKQELNVEDLRKESKRNKNTKR